MMGENLHDRVRAKLSSLDTTFRVPETPARTFGPFYQRAAVLTSFDPTSMQQSAPEADQDEFYAVLADSDYAGSGSQWTLDESVRRRVFETLENPKAILEVLDRLESTPIDPTQRMFVKYLQRTAPPLDDQTLAEITGTLQISQWLPQVIREEIGLPDNALVQSHIDRIDLLQPFRWLVGEHFSGRASELRVLRDYVGVLEPSSAYTSILRGVRHVFSLHEEPPLVIHGTGGIGKSTLISRFILDHAELPIDQRFPFVYIDFDRPGIIPDQPVTLLLEAVRQLGIQRPELIEHADAIREEWHERLQSASTEKIDSIRLVQSFASDFRRLLERMSFAEQPLLFVLDTFEEVQYRGDGFVREVGDFLDLLQKTWPRLRTVVSGRAPVRGFPFTPRELALGDLDLEATQGFLRAHGIANPEAARRLARQVGGNPLTLCLAVELLRREASEELRGIDTRKYFLVRLRSEQIQGQLYRRILWHVGNDNPSIKKIVHPGLVLRRLTPELIRDVLAVPCGLQNEDPVELFDAMRREVSLLEPERDGALRHRADVRRVMLRLLNADEPDTVTQIHRLAVGYYVDKQEGETDQQRIRISRAEELYHRMALGQDSAVLDSRWMPGTELELAGALDELKAREQAYLAFRLGMTLDASIRARANLETWERSTETTVRRLLGLGRLKEALAALNERTERSAESRLHIFDAVVRERLGQWEEAAEVADRALAQASESGEVSLIFDLLLIRARLAANLTDEVAAGKHLNEAMLLADTAHDDLMRLRAGLAMRRYLIATPARLGADLEHWFRTLPDETLVRHLDVVVEAAAFIPRRRSSLPPAVAGSESAAAPAGEGGSESAAAPAGEGGPDRAAAPAEAQGAEASPPAADLQDPTEPPPAPPVDGFPAAFDVPLRAVRLVGLQAATGAERRHLARELLKWEQQISERTGESPGLLAQEVGLGSHPNVAELWRRVAESRSATELNDVIIRVLQRPNVPPELSDAVLAIFQRMSDDADVEAAGQNIAASGGAQGREDLKLYSNQADQFVHAVASTYSLAELSEVINARLHRSVRSISVESSLPLVVTDLVRDARSNRWMSDLVAALMDARPDAPVLQAFAQEIGLASISVTDDELRQLLEETQSYLGGDDWRARLGELEAQVCRIEVGSTAGTGFLISPEHVLTSAAVMDAVMQGIVPPQDVVLRFDARSLRGTHGETPISHGREFGLTTRWLVESDESTMVLGVEGMPGDQPIGASEFGFEELARTRGWIRLSGSPADMARNRALHVLAAGRHSLMLLRSTQEGVEMADDGSRLFYTLTADIDATGSPCFDENLDLVALHLGHDAERGVSAAVAIDRTSGSSHGLHSEMLAL